MPEPVVYSELLKGVLAVASLVVTGFAIPWLRAHVGAKHLDLAERAAVVAVSAVEQMGGGTGAHKFQNALERARALAASKGVTLSDEQWRTLIESAVRDFKQWGAEIKAPPRIVEEL